MRSGKLTRKQMEVLATIKEFIKLHGYSPSFREIADLVHLASPSTVYGHLGQLKKKGFINWEPTQPRTIQILRTAV